MRDGMAYALKNFKTLLLQAKYPVILLVVTQLVALWAQEKVMFDTMQTQLSVVHGILYMVAGFLVLFCAMWMLSTFVQQQRQQIMQPVSDGNERSKSQPKLLHLGGRVFVASLVQGFVFSIIAVLLFFVNMQVYLFLSTHITTLDLLYMIVAAVVVWSFVLLLYVMGMLRLLYMQYVYGDTSFVRSVLQLGALRRYVRRTIALEVLLCFACILLCIAFAAPLWVTSYINGLSMMSEIKMDGTDVPSYFWGLRYFAAIVATLGSAFAMMLCSYPVCYNYLSIQKREAERAQQ